MVHLLHSSYNQQPYQNHLKNNSFFEVGQNTIVKETYFTNFVFPMSGMIQPCPLYKRLFSDFIFSTG